MFTSRHRHREQQRTRIQRRRCCYHCCLAIKCHKMLKYIKLNTKVLTNLKLLLLSDSKKSMWHNDKQLGKLDTFHRAIKPYIFIAQFFGVLPLLNVLSTNPANVRFSIRTLGMLSTACFFIFGGLRALHITGRILSAGVTTRSIITIVYLATNTWVCVQFLNLARKWPQLIQYWTEVELIFLMPPYKRCRLQLKTQVALVFLCFFVVALTEHMLYYCSNFYNYRMQLMQCEPNNTALSFRDYLIHSQYRDIFRFITFSWPTAVYAFLLNATFNFIWNFMDIFIMLVSLGLATRFQQFGEFVRELRGQHVSDAAWYQLRQHHIKLCDLIEFVDEQLSLIILTSSLFNMYFICNQLLNIFTKLRWPINYIYFWVSLLLLLTRTASVFMFASRISEASLMPLQTLYYVSSTEWTEEVQRFVAQIRNEEIGLTGKRFYVLTRGSLFGLVATIITYEFMLLQFDVKSRKSGLPDMCS